MSQDTTDERAAFEEWCATELNYGYDFAKDAKGNYTHDATETAWYAWEARAARAAIAAQAPQDQGVPAGDFMAAVRPKGEDGLRDHFAGQAMQGFLTGHIAHHGHENHWAYADMAGCAYQVADAMLAARASTKGGKP